MKAMNPVKIISLLVILTFSVALHAQTLENKKWIKIKAERKDGSKIISRSNIETTELIYFFKNDGKVILTTKYKISELAYTKKASLIKIDPSQTMDIEQITDSSLVMVEVPDIKLTPDKFNRLYFISEDYYEKYLRENNLFSFLDDSTIISNRYLKPIFKKGDISDYFQKKYTLFYSTSFITGSFVISPSGALSNIELINEGNLSEHNKNSFIKILKGTSNFWETPKLSRPFYFKVNFSVKFYHEKIQNMDTYSIMFNFDDKENSSCIECSNISIDDMALSKKYFIKGTSLLAANNIEDAILYYTKCIQKDSCFLDAYYNRAFSLYKLKNYEAACKDWEYLYKLEQKDGEKMYFENCKKK